MYLQKADKEGQPKKGGQCTRLPGSGYRRHSRHAFSPPPHASSASLSWFKLPSKPRSKAFKSQLIARCLKAEGKRIPPKLYTQEARFPVEWNSVPGDVETAEFTLEEVSPHYFCSLKCCYLKKKKKSFSWLRLLSNKQLFFQLNDHLLPLGIWELEEFWNSALRIHTCYKFTNSSPMLSQQHRLP